MSNAALLFHPEPYDTSGKELMGRHSAGESFLRGFLRHADVERFYFWNWGSTAHDRAEALLNRVEPVTKPVTWIGRTDYARIGDVGALFFPAPANVLEAWNRRRIGPRRYSITGITHTTATGQVMDAIVNMVLAPVEPWDSLICTSSAVKDSLTGHVERAVEYLRGRLGPITPPSIRFDTIPLGVNAENFATTDEHRARWRAELGIPDEAVVALYMGRFSIHSKMNPAPMGVALARAAAETGKPVHWVLAGWASENSRATYEQAVRESASGVTVHFVDGRRPDARFSIWSVGDLFISFSDNIQETYGLTPVEAMAAGLPCVISDWDGYKDTVRHGVDGFRIPTVAPGPGGGADFAYRFLNDLERYEAYIAGASHVIAVDLVEATRALVTLINDAGLRRKMGDAGRERVRRQFDWSAIIPQYQALWAELNAIRTSGGSVTPGQGNPWRPDPFTLFANYPTEVQHEGMLYAAQPGATLAAIAPLMASPAAHFVLHYIPTPAEMTAMLAQLLANGPMTAEAVVAAAPPVRRPIMSRGLLWLVKHGLATVVNARPTPLD